MDAASGYGWQANLARPAHLFHHLPHSTSQFNSNACFSSHTTHLHSPQTPAAAEWCSRPVSYCIPEQPFAMSTALEKKKAENLKQANEAYEKAVKL